MGICSKVTSPRSCYLGALKRVLEGDIPGVLALQGKADQSRKTFGYSFSEPVSEDSPFVEEAVKPCSPRMILQGVRGRMVPRMAPGKVQKGSENEDADSIPKTGKRERTCFRGQKSTNMAAFLKPGMEVDFYRKGSGNRPWVIGLPPLLLITRSL